MLLSVSRLALPLLDRVLVVVAAVVFWLPLPLLDRFPVLLCCYDCTWWKERHGGKDVDRGHVGVVDDAKGLLPVLSAFRCCVVCMPRLPLPLSDRIPVVFVAAAVVFRLHLEGRMSWWRMLIEDVLALLMMTEDCWGAKKSNKHVIDCDCNWSNRVIESNTS